MAHIDIGQDSVLNLYRDVEVTAGLELVFSNDTQRYNYFNKRLVKQYSGLSYVYRNGVIKIQDTPQVVAQCNFISFNNPSFESKPIYARIIDYRYVNNATVEITYAVDYWLTFMFDISFRSCQIMREHLSEADWQKALANPWRHDILELETAESFNFDEDDYNQIDVDGPQHYRFTHHPNAGNYAVLVTGKVQATYTDSKPDAGFVHLDSWAKSFSELPSDIASLPTLSRRKISGASINNIPNASTVWIMGPQAASSVGGLASWEGVDLSAKSYLSYGLDSLVESGQTSSVVAVYLMTEEHLRAALTPNGNKYTLTVTGKTTAGDPKLSRFPYSYLKVTTPDTGAKEYHFEKFRSPVSGISFALYGTLNSNYASYLMPVDYMYGGTPDRYSWNFNERIEFKNMPQIGYNVDSFLTYMSGVYSETRDWQASTATPLQKAGVLAGAAGGNMLEGLMTGSTFSGPAGMAGAVAGSVGGAASIMGRDVQARNAAAYSGVEGSRPYYDYAAEKTRYISSNYVPGSFGSGLAFALYRDEFEGFFMTLNESNRQKVANYFQMFGYNSGRIGIPRVCSIVTGSGATPHFVTWDGDPCTYVQTADMRVISPMKPASDYIEAIFNSGHRFIKGDGR